MSNMPVGKVKLKLMRGEANIKSPNINLRHHLNNATKSKVQIQQEVILGANINETNSITFELEGA